MMSLNFCANFSGSNYLNISNYTGNPAAFSVSQWVWVNGNQTSRVFLANFLTGGTNKGWVTGISDSSTNKVKFYLGSNTLSQTGTLTNYLWTHVVCTWDGTTAKIYLNGNATPDSTLTSGVSYGAVPTNNYISTLDGTNQKFNGQLAGVGYWSKALSTTEISTLYNNGNGLAGSELTGTLLTSLVSYHDFIDSTSLGTDSSGNSHTFTNTGTVTQNYGPDRPYPTYTGHSHRPNRPVLQNNLVRGLVRSQIFQNPALFDEARRTGDSVGAGSSPGVGTVAFGNNNYGRCFLPSDSNTGNINMGTPIASGATEFTLSALVSADTLIGGNAGLRHLWGAEASAATDLRIAITNGVLFFQVGNDGAFTNLNVAPPNLNVPMVITCRLTTSGVRSIWFGPVKYAERTDSGCAYGSNGATLGLGSSAYFNTRNWSGQITGGLIWNIGIPDSHIMTIGQDFFAYYRQKQFSIFDTFSSTPNINFLRIPFDGLRIGSSLSGF